MSKYLVLDEYIKLSVTKEGFPNSRNFQLVGSGIVPVWFANKDAGIVGECVAKFYARTKVANVIDDVKFCVNQLEQQFSKKGTGYIALGASPKLIKWMLKARGFNVATVNASGIKYGDKSTEAFDKYLQKKLEKLGSCQKYVVMDFADSGSSLAVIKEKVKFFRSDSDVKSVAIGAVKEVIKYPPDSIIRLSSELSNSLQTQNTKLHLLGRNKVKNVYSNWSTDTSKQLDNTIQLNSKALGEAWGVNNGQNLSNSEFFQIQKKIIPSVLQLPKLVIGEDEWEELFITAAPHVCDSDEDFDSLSDDSDYDF